jgi:hypothetical protein
MPREVGWSSATASSENSMSELVGTYGRCPTISVVERR